MQLMPLPLTAAINPVEEEVEDKTWRVLIPRVKGIDVKPLPPSETLRLLQFLGVNADDLVGSMLLTLWGQCC